MSGATPNGLHSHWLRLSPPGHVDKQFWVDLGSISAANIRARAYEGRALRQADIGCLYFTGHLVGAGDECDHLAVGRARLMRCEWDAKDFETLDFRERLGRIWRNQLQHGSLNISSDKPIEGAGVRYRKLDI
jgi:hypothetical protein